jgi:adenosylcobinamide-phosphate synthase
LLLALAQGGMSRRAVPKANGTAARQGEGIPVNWRLLRTEARRTPSPNSGWPMAAMALALGIALRKPGVYVLHVQGRAPQPADTAAAAMLASRVLVLLVALTVAALVLIFVWRM